jgi:hypothetical protein
MIIGRRKFFSFFGTGVAMLASPDLLLPKTEIVAATEEEIKPWSPEQMEAYLELVRNSKPTFMLAG